MARRKLFMCFRPAVKTVSEAKEKKISRSMSDEDVACAGKGQKRKSHRRFSRVLQAVLFNVSLTKNRKKKSRENIKFSKAGDMHKNNSSCASSLFSSSANGSLTSSSSCCSSRSSSGRKGLSETNIVESKQVLKKSFANMGLWLLLFSLFVLVIWGKMCAILCTSALFFLVPRRFKVIESPVNVVDLPDVDSKEYKKKVIMGGILDRSRGRLL